MNARMHARIHSFIHALEVYICVDVWIDHLPMWFKFLFLCLFYILYVSNRKYLRLAVHSSVLALVLCVRMKKELNRATG